MNREETHPNIDSDSGERSNCSALTSTISQQLDINQKSNKEDDNTSSDTTNNIIPNSNNDNSNNNNNNNNNNNILVVDPPKVIIKEGYLIKVCCHVLDIPFLFYTYSSEINEKRKESYISRFLYDNLFLLLLILYITITIYY